MKYAKGQVQNGKVVLTDVKQIDLSTLTANCLLIQANGAKACKICKNLNKPRKCGVPLPVTEKRKSVEHIGGSIEEALKQIGMHREMVTLIQNIKNYDIKVITDQFISYMKTLNINQVAVFWKLIQDINADVANKMYVSNPTFTVIVMDSLYSLNKKDVGLIMAEHNIFKVYEKALLE